MSADFCQAIVADDDDFFRLALSSILRERHGIDIVQEAASYSEALDILKRETREQIAFFDLDMPGMDDMALLTSLRRAHPSVRVVVVSASVSRQLILSALEAGVHGYVSKVVGPSEVSRALGIILSGDIYVPVSLAELTDAPGTTVFKRPGIASLTPRQREVLSLVVQGASNRDIAAKLGLGEGTVKVHVAGLLRALDVNKRSEVAQVAAQWGDDSSP